MSLWSSENPEDWHSHLEETNSRVAALQKPQLVELDRWWLEELPSVLQGRQERYLDKKEVVKLVEWKLKRGKWRPKLLDYAKNASEDAVSAKTKAAFGFLGNDAEPTVQRVKDSLDELVSLKGIGPATASAMLAVANPSLPFMSDEAMAAALPKPHRYSAKEYLQLLEALRDKAAKLSKSAGTAWTAAQVERALWSEALAKQLSTPSSKGTKRKR